MAHVIMDAEGSQDLQTRDSMVKVLIQVKRQKKTNVPTQRWTEEKKLFSYSDFVLVRPSTDWMWPTHTGKAICFTQPTKC